jgi:hypothetical protein
MKRLTTRPGRRIMKYFQESQNPNSQEIGSFLNSLWNFAQNHNIEILQPIVDGASKEATAWGDSPGSVTRTAQPPECGYVSTLSRHISEYLDTFSSPKTI